ncbi:glycosyltransferase family 4 protein [Candidatus Woesearchaeota archaeon]|nr:glycosyltransferase family 4 protein [Candidatus Woesearchaeota archaeon]
MNIAFYTNFIDTEIPEATKISVLSLAKELSKENKVVIIARHTKNSKKEEILEGIKIFRFNKLFYPFGLFLCQKKENLKFDIVQSFSSAPIKILDLLFVRLFSRTKIVHNVKSHSKHWLGSYKFAFLLNLADAIITNSNIIKTKLMQNGCKKKINLINSHIDLTKFKLQKKKNSDKKTILYYGPFSKRKGVELLMNAIPKINKLVKGIEFKFLCKDQNYDEQLYQPLIEDLKEEKNVLIKFGKTNNLVDEINNAYLAVFPYPDLIATETNPLSILECVACKTPVLTSDLPEIKEMFDENELLFFSPKNKESLIVKLIYALNSKNLNKLTEKAFLKIKNYDLKSISKKFLSVYLSLKK